MNNEAKAQQPCTTYMHTWIATTENGTMRRCCWCGISEIIWLARQEREVAENAKAMIIRHGLTSA